MINTKALCAIPLAVPAAEPVEDSVSQIEMSLWRGAKALDEILVGIGLVKLDYLNSLRLV